MTSRERDVIRAAALMARRSSSNNGVQWASQLLLDLLAFGSAGAQCPACDGSKIFRGNECSHCEGTGTADGVVQRCLKFYGYPQENEDADAGGSDDRGEAAERTG